MAHSSIGCIFTGGCSTPEQWGHVSLFSKLWGARRASLLFQYLDRNKRGLTLNLKDPRGVEIVMALAEGRDSLV